MIFIYSYIIVVIFLLLIFEIEEFREISFFIYIPLVNILFLIACLVQKIENLKEKNGVKFFYGIHYLIEKYNKMILKKIHEIDDPYGEEDWNE